jgi:exosortase A-associated hydrolase 1
LKVTESAVVFDCAGERLLGVASVPDRPRSIGVLIVVGGRQYRVGSHRQFVLLSRRAAAAGYCAFRFDLRGMGDSTGDRRNFAEVDADIAAAIAAFQAQCPQVERVVLWGLCDAATAAMHYWQRSRDVRVSGMCLANPWLRSEATLARTRVRHYYRERIFDPAFWRKLLSGKVGPLRALHEYFGAVRASQGSASGGFQSVMLQGMRDFPGFVLLVLSEHDLTAQEFLVRMQEDPADAALLLRPRLRRVNIAEADHTFSRERWKNEVEDALLAWLPEIIEA